MSDAMATLREQPWFYPAGAYFGRPGGRCSVAAGDVTATGTVESVVPGGTRVILDGTGTRVLVPGPMVYELKEDG